MSGRLYERFFPPKTLIKLFCALALYGVLRGLQDSEGRRVHVEDNENYRDVKNTDSLYLASNFEEDFNNFLQNFKVHVYNIKANLTQVFESVRKIEVHQKGIPEHWLVKKRRTFPKINPEGQYALDAWLKTWIINSNFNELSPSNATAFFIEFKCTALKNSQKKRFSGQRFTQQYIRQVIQEISKGYPENTHKLNFLDHFYACAHDMGVECTRSAPENFRNNAIGVVHTADFFGGDANLNFWNDYDDIKPSWQSGLVFNGHRDITATPFLTSDILKVRKSYRKCKYLTMFLGSVNGRAVRQRVFHQHQNRKDIFLGKAYGEYYAKAFHDSKFCLVIRGLVTSTLRISEAFKYGCIPVIIIDGYVPPFSNTIDWSKFSIIIPENQTQQIPKILEGISETRWNAMNKNLLDIRHHFLYNEIPVVGDAFHMILYEVWLKTKKFLFHKSSLY